MRNYVKTYLNTLAAYTFLSTFSVYKIKKMRFLFSIIFIALFTTAGTGPVKQLPDVSVKTLEGKTVKLKEIVADHKLTVISFWATWCSPCKKELTALSDYYEDWKDEYDVELVAITIDDNRALPKVKPMVETKGWPFIILSDSNQDLMRALNFQTVPQTFVVDQSGNIVYEHPGYSPGDEYELEDKIVELSK